MDVAVNVLARAASVWARARRDLLQAQAGFEMARRSVPAGQPAENESAVVGACERLHEARVALAAAELALLTQVPDGA